MPGQELTISGWGETEEGKSLSNVVRWANVTVFDNESCKNISRIKKKPYPSTDFCAGKTSIMILFLFFNLFNF